MKAVLVLTAILVVLVAVAVAVVVFLDVPAWIARLAVLVAAIVWLVVLAAFGIRWLLARRARQSSQLAARAELKRRRADLRAALRQLDRQQRRTRPRQPLLASPRPDIRAVVLGLPRHGKTELVRLAAPSTLIEVDGSGPVRDEPAKVEDDRPRLFAGPVSLLEIPHALARSSDLRPTWLATLRTLRRGKQPLHGVVLAVSVEELLLAGAEAQAIRIGDELAPVIEDVQKVLGVRVPVHLVVTKLDRIAGFSGLFAGTEPRQPLGFALPDVAGKQELARALGERFEDLCDALHRRAVALLSRLRDPEARAQHLVFVQQLAALLRPLSALATRLTMTGVGAPIRLRSVHFGSALQSPAAPLAPILDGLPGAASGGVFTGEPGEPAGVRRFLDDLIAVVLPRDAQLAGRSPGVRGRMLATRVGLGVAGVLFAVYATVAMTRVMRRNSDLAEQTVATSVAVMQEIEVERSSPLAPATMAASLDVLDRWEDQNGDDPAGVHGWGFHAETRFREPLRDLVRRAALAGVVAPLRRAVEVDLQRFAARFEAAGLVPEPSERAVVLEHLRFYLLLTGPGGAHEPASMSQESAFVRAQLASRWADAVREDGGPAADDRIADAVERMSPLLTDADLEHPRDLRLVATVREILARELPVELELADILARVGTEGDLPPISLRRVSEVPSLDSAESDVPGVFTSQGWELVRTHLQPATSEDWVLGDEPEPGQTKRLERSRALRSAYFKRYIEAWSRWIAGVHVVTPTTLVEAGQTLGDLTRGPEPALVSVYRTLAEHTTLRDDLEPATARPGEVLAGDVRRTFEPLLAFTTPVPDKPGETALEQYHVQLGELRTALEATLDNPERETELMARLEQTISDVRALVERGNLGSWKVETQQLLVQPLEELRRIVRGGQAGVLTEDWCARVVEPLHERFAGRYPFVSGSPRDVALADVAEFYHPETGIIRKAREELLGGWVVQRGDRFELRERGTGEALRVDPAVLRFLERAQDIGSKLFVDDALQVDFEVTLACNPHVGRVVLTVDGKSAAFACDNAPPTRMRWPSEDDHRAQLAVEGRTPAGLPAHKTLSRPGEWGLFRLLESATSTTSSPGGEPTAVFRFALPPLDVVAVHVRPLRAHSADVFHADGKFLGLLRGADVLAPRRLFTSIPCRR